MDRRIRGTYHMAKTFGFTDDELKLLLVAVRQMRRTFARPRQSDAALEAYASLYDGLAEKLREMAGPLPGEVDELMRG
jgi:predicted DNA-binding transcriptional regulator YafY